MGPQGLGDPRNRAFEYSCDPVSPTSDLRAIPRALADSEWPALRGAVNVVFRPDGGDLTHDSPLLFEPANRENLRVIVQDDQIASHAGFVTREAMVLRRCVRIACIGAVFTAVAERGRGLATRVLLDALGRGRPGADLVMASGDRGLYRRHGFEPVPPLARFRLPAAASPGAGLEIRAANAPDLDAMAALYDAENVHFVRPIADWQRLFDAGMLVDAPASFSVVVRGGQIVAYIAAQRGGKRADGSVRPRRILEFAGDRTAIADAAPTLAEEILVATYDTSTIGVFERKRWTRTARQFLITAEALTANVLVIPWYGLNYL
jgi:GNAT superfamily N-acetyltransferase